ncbi:signal transduction histidine kinase [Saccharothrix carnea]|uniref:histidine kinase n=1 Tax=Saccharothrix carnea TaxID=1280637 RepID=A0A2P8HZI9_SACCR|nr:ATP-binding protein [Saccharothrix carnea]PSL51632.1 signal transduction histidine kinase [Saccharothrix carnea]
MGRRALPRRTVRLRLTLLYGGLFLLCGAGLLTVTFFLVRHAVTPMDDVTLFRYPGAPVEPGPPDKPLLPPPGSMAARIVAQAEEALTEQRQDVLRQLLVQSVVALGLTMVLALALGWWVAGRVLRRLRTITAAARQISATNLHRRLALTGPEDELKELGDTFDELLGRLEASFQAQRRFVANASHELRTPLARQRAIGQVALDDPDATTASLRAAHERVLAAGVQQERLIEAMLTLARGHAGIDVRHPFDLGEVVTEVVDVRRAPDVRLRVAVEPCVVSGHRALAERLVVNLVDNAIRHNVPAGWVEVTCASGVLTVTNSGPVVPPDEVRRILQPFHRLGPARTGHGVGLGLSIVQAIATAHDAAVDVTARPDGGLAVTVAFTT